MLNPCNPCCCPGAPCEQCMFGYNSAETNHRIMKQLLNEYINGDKPIGWANAKLYMEFHKDWKKEMESEPQKTVEFPKANKQETEETTMKMYDMRMFETGTELRAFLLNFRGEIVSVYYAKHSHCVVFKR